MQAYDLHAARAAAGRKPPPLEQNFITGEVSPC
jgi:hypothetical protein